MTCKLTHRPQNTYICEVQKRLSTFAKQHVKKDNETLVFVCLIYVHVEVVVMYTRFGVLQTSESQYQEMA